MPALPTRSEGPPGEPRTLELLGVDLAHPADQVRAETPLRVAADALLHDLHPGEPLGFLADLEVHLFGNELRDGDRLVAVVELRPELLAELLRRDAEDLREVRDDSASSPSSSRLIRTSRLPVVDERPTLTIEDVPPQRVRLDGPDRVVARVAFVLRAGEDLEEPQSRGERDEHERHHEGEHLETAGRPVHQNRTTRPACVAADARRTGRRSASARRRRRPSRTTSPRSRTPSSSSEEEGHGLVERHAGAVPSATRIAEQRRRRRDVLPREPRCSRGSSA